MQGVFDKQAVFDIGIPILGTLIWSCPNLIFSKTEATVPHNSSFLIKSAIQSELNNQTKRKQM